MSLMMRLKHITRPLHDELESLEISKKLLSNHIDKTDYTRYLMAMKKIHQQVESQFERYFSARTLQPLMMRQRLPFIIADLIALGQAQTTDGQAEAWMIPWSLESLLGAIYVLEGSTLGGQVIAKRITHLVGNDGLVATRYLTAYQDDTLGQWQSFTLFLDDFAIKNPSSTDRILLGAIAAYLRIKHEMNDYY